MTATNTTLDRQTLTACVVASVLGPVLAIYVAIRGIQVANLGATNDSVVLLVVAGMLLALGPMSAARYTRSQGWAKVAIACLFAPALLLLV